MEDFPPSIRPCVVSFTGVQLASTFFYSAMAFDTGTVGPSEFVRVTAELVPSHNAVDVGEVDTYV